MTNTYTYVSRRNSNYFRYTLNTANFNKFMFDNYTSLSIPQKIVFSIKNYPNRRSFYFNEWNNIKSIGKKVIEELGNDSKIINIYWNEFSIKYNNDIYEITRNFSSDLVWNSYEITKII